MSVKKKQVLTATLLIALVAAVAVNWYYSRPDSANESSEATGQTAENLGDSLLVAGSVQSEEESEEEETTSLQDNVIDEEYFAEAKLKRTNMHDEMIEEIEDVLENENLSQEDKSKVTTLLTQFKEDLQAETDTENLIKAKTGGECLVIINDSTAQVVLPEGTLNDNVLIQITEIFELNTEISAENLTIIEAK